jgi:hypothetical protein
MKKQFLSLILVLCMIFTMMPSMAGFDPPDELDPAYSSIKIENGETADKVKLTYGGDSWEVPSTNPITITQTNPETTTPSAIVISADVTNGVNIKLNGVSVEGTGNAALTITDTAGKVNLILADGSVNRLKGTSFYAGLQKNNTAKGDAGLLTISCESAGSADHECNDTTNCGKLFTTGGGFGAGIGGGNGGAGSHITISGGNVTTTGGDFGAGIGGGNGGAGSDITISGGNVTTTGGDFGAGIGGGDEGAGSHITISGGNVTATGSSRGGASIGGGSDGAGSVITISGGIVSATGTDGGAAIGGGKSTFGTGGAGEDITISGGTVIAKSNTTAYDIGAGGTNIRGISSNIIITGGNVYASSIGETPKNGSGTEVYKATFSIPDDTTGGTTLDAISFNMNNNPYSYGMNDTRSILDVDVKGKLFVYLPIGTYSTVYEDNTYTAIVNNSGDAEFVLPPADITAASVIITAPVPGAAPQDAAAVQAATNHADYTVTGLVWNEPLTAGGKFKADQVYTATVTLTSKNGKKFQSDAFTPTVAGSSSVGTTTTSGGDVVGNTVSFAVTYPVTGALEVSSIAVTTQPTKMSYTESTDSVLALNGMQITETNNDGSTNVVTFTDGTAAGYTTNPANGSTLTNVTHNGTPVVITHAASVNTANTNNLTVNTSPSGGGGGGSGNSTPVPPPAPVITVSEVKSELFEKAEDIKVEADVTSAFGQSVEVRITDNTDSQNEIFSLAGTNEEVYPFDISLYSKESKQKVQPRDGYSVKITIPVPEKLLGDKNKIKVVYGKDGKLETLKSELFEKDGKWYITFEATHFSPYALIVSPEPTLSWTNPFSDVKEGDWYYSAVQYVAQNGLMFGTSSSTFSPELTTNRGMIATILYRLSGSSETLQSTFKDVIPGAYYANAVAWAQEKGIIAGYGNGMFGPEDSITREQMAAILWRYAGSPVAADSEGLDNFKDAVEISSYAKNALVWAHQQGIIAGKGNGILDPQGKATRAEVAQILYIFGQNNSLN